jgi:LuxR family maltose regulon positive regulatory protein
VRGGAFVRDGVLAFDPCRAEQGVAVGSQEWVAWLQQPSSTVFRFEDRAARFTARRELQRGREYWYAYRRQGGRLRKA